MCRVYVGKKVMLRPERWVRRSRVGGDALNAKLRDMGSIMLANRSQKK